MAGTWDYCLSMSRKQIASALDLTPAQVAVECHREFDRIARLTGRGVSDARIWTEVRESLTSRAQASISLSKRRKHAIRDMDAAFAEFAAADRTAAWA